MLVGAIKSKREESEPAHTQRDCRMLAVLV